MENMSLLIGLKYLFIHGACTLSCKQICRLLTLVTCGSNRCHGEVIQNHAQTVIIQDRMKGSKFRCLSSSALSMVII